ncbi:hypothetical protein XIS1_2060001 [Xenorhabdus innexi]|uniref:Uncharacterized protein n=1 Tax=Xenorhabdus innexi TaxID=290109 RepID=A0A1N6MX08_9GAMM|nr:hypothetical protein XIS1_2060001 [Xenorhabdus innexi]
MQLDSWSGTSNTINIDPKGTLALNLAGKSPFGSVLVGQGLVNKMGNGETTFSSSSPDFLGTMNVEAGQLFVADNAQLGGKTAQLNVKKAAPLGAAVKWAARRSLKAAGI